MKIPFLFLALISACGLRLPHEKIYWDGNYCIGVTLTMECGVTIYCDDGKTIECVQQLVIAEEVRP